MFASRNIPKIFACCRKYQHSICLKLWIMVFVCSLLCLTCFVIENRRSEIIKNRGIKAKQDAQKLIQIKSNFNNFITKNDAIEESSGYYAEGNGIVSERVEQYPNEENEPTADNREMLAASNCVSKSSGLLTETQISSEHESNEYTCKDMAEQVEKLLELPGFSETQANNIFLDYEAEIPEDYHQANEYEWVDNLERETDLLQFQLDEDSEPLYQLPDDENNMPVTWDSEDRFFPDEYAFQVKSSENVYFDRPHNEIRTANDLFTEKIAPSDIPSMIDTFLGKISTLFVPPPIPIRKPDLTHLSNFKDIPFTVEGMRLAPSKINPVWQLYSNEPNSNLRHSLKPTLNFRSRRNIKAKIFGKRRENGKFLPKLLRILREK